MPPKKKKQKDYPGQPWRLPGERPRESADRLYRALEVEKTQHQLAKDELQAEKERHLLTKDLLKRTTSELLEKAEANKILERAKANLTRRVSDLEKDKVNLTKRASDLEIEKEDLTKKVADLEIEKADITKKVADLEIEKADLTKKVADLEIKIERTADQNREQIREQNGVIADLRKNIANLESAVSSLESDLETRTEAHDNERAELNQTITELQETITNNLNLHTGEKEKLEAEIEVAKEKLTDLENRYKTDKESTNEIIDTLKLEKQQHQTTIEEHKATIIELQALLDADVDIPEQDKNGDVDKKEEIEDEVIEDIDVDIPEQDENGDVEKEDDDISLYDFVPTSEDDYVIGNSYLSLDVGKKAFKKYDSFNELTTGEKKDFLIDLSSQIDNMYNNWTGCKTNPSQVLEFPRDGAKTIPLDIKKAIIEYGKQLLEDPLIHNTNNISRKKLGDSDISFNSGESGRNISPIVSSYLSKYITNVYDRRTKRRYY